MAGEIKNLLFDLGGVICDININNGVEAFNRLGINDIDSLLNRYKQDGIFHDFECGNVDNEEFCAHLRELSGKPYLSDNQIMNAWNSIIVGFPQPRLKKLMELKKRYNLYLLSNTNPCHFQFFPSQMGFFRLEDFFTTLFLSFNMGVCKPEKEIFDLVVELAQIKPQETLFIDDSVANIDAAKLLGFQTFLVKNGDDWLSLNL